MKFIKILSCAALMTGAGFGTAFAGCGIDSGRISILANDFPALHCRSVKSRGVCRRER
jgi:hypothetical protein